MRNLICKDDSALFDLLKKAHEGNDESAKVKVAIAMQAFMREPLKISSVKIQAMRKAINAFAVSTDFDKLVSDAFNVTIQSDNFDLGYQEALKDVPVAEGQDSWDIYDVANSLHFRLVQEGGRIPVEGLYGTVVTAHVHKYGGSLGWTDEMIRFRKIAAMVDKASIFRNKFFADKAENHYVLLATGAAVNILAYQGQVADGRLRRDIQTINRGCFDIGNRCKDKGYGDMANARFILYANPLDKTRITAAFSASTSGMQAQAGVADVIGYPITVIYTFNSNIRSGHPILVLPGNKNQKAEVMAPTTFTAPIDVLSLINTQAVWSYYGAAIGDTDQLEEITLS